MKQFIGKHTAPYQKFHWLDVERCKQVSQKSPINAPFDPNGSGDQLGPLTNETDIVRNASYQLAYTLVNTHKLHLYNPLTNLVEGFFIARLRRRNVA